MTSIVINADDCGINRDVDMAIKYFIEKGLVTSTTIMSNMNDFSGAIELYREFNKIVSFGVHLNLTQGSPLTCCDALVDAGIVVEKNGIFEFSGRFPYTMVSKAVLSDVKKELCTQIEHILDSGIKPSHIDGHHHVHTYPSLITATPFLMKKYDIRKVRRMRNFVPEFLQKIVRSSWLNVINIQLTHASSTNFFCDIQEFFNNPRDRNASLELMCHPGGYIKEEFEYMDKLIIPEYVQLKNYHNI